MIRQLLNVQSRLLLRKRNHTYPNVRATSRPCGCSCCGTSTACHALASFGSIDWRFSKSGWFVASTSAAWKRPRFVAVYGSHIWGQKGRPNAEHNVLKLSSGFCTRSSKWSRSFRSLGMSAKNSRMLEFDWVHMRSCVSHEEDGSCWGCVWPWTNSCLHRSFTEDAIAARGWRTRWMYVGLFIIRSALCRVLKSIDIVGDFSQRIWGDAPACINHT